MKKKVLLIGLGFILILLIGGFAVHIWIGITVKSNIKIAKEEYTGTAEEALLKFLQDEDKSAEGRTHTAIWTLGQIHSEKALPVLYQYYKDDPKGITCYGKHDSLLCQYEIYKAIVAIERGRLFSHARLNK